MTKKFSREYLTKELGLPYDCCPIEDNIIDTSRWSIIDYYCSKAYNFGLLSFDRGNPVVGEELFNKMEELTKKLRKIEWRMVGGNPVEKHYDKFCKKHGGNKHILKDSVRDSHGNYHDDIIYEIIND